MLIPAIFFTSTSAVDTNSHETIKSEVNSKFRKVHLVGSFSTSGGCTIGYDVYVDIVTVFGWPPIKVKSVEGTLTFSGTCHGQQNINIQMKATATCYPDGTTTIDWDYLSDPYAEEDLNDKSFLEPFAAEVASAETD